MVFLKILNVEYSRQRKWSNRQICVNLKREARRRWSASERPSSTVTSSTSPSPRASKRSLSLPFFLSLPISTNSSRSTIQISRNSSLWFRASNSTANLMCCCRLAWVHSRSCFQSLFSTTKRRLIILGNSKEGYHPLRFELITIAYRFCFYFIRRLKLGRSCDKK